MEFYLFKYLHLIGIFGVVGALAIELVLTKRLISKTTLLLLTKVDAVYGISSILVLLGGFAMWFWVGKPAEYYNENGLLHTKIGLFIIIGLLSLYPTIYFIKQRKLDIEQVDIPQLILWFIKVELILLAMIPLLAVLMADGRTTLF